MHRTTSAVALALSGALALAGCSSSLGAQAWSGDQKAYVAGDGTWKLLPASQRTTPVELRGTAADGSTVDIADWRGDVVVANVWYAGCAPCRAEAPDLAKTAVDTAAQGVHFVGINTRDDAGTAQAFERRFAVPYPSVLDAHEGTALLALRGLIPPQAVPSTVVIDAQGRPAARILGRLQPDVLRGLIQQVAADSAAGAAAPSATTAAAG